jgi:hypothetical protein
MSINLTPKEQFDQDLLDSGRSYGVTLDLKVAQRLTKSFSRGLRDKFEYRACRTYVLEKHVPLEASDKERAAYEDFLNRRAQSWRKQAKELKSRPVAPPDAR